jgi:hypothetical protein
MNATAYWKTVRSMCEVLPAVLHITTATASDDGRVAGVVIESTAAIAAKLLVDGSHRLSTAQEIERYLGEQDRRRILAGVRSDAACGKFRFSELESDTRAASAAVAPDKKGN